MSEQQQQPTQTLTTKNLFAKDEVRNKFQEMLGKRAPQFITSVLQIVASNKLLANADPHSVYHAAAVAATLDLPLNNNLGFAYIVPYNESFKDDKGQWHKKPVAQFQMGYKGFIQLGQRTGQYKTINALDVREGELIGENMLTGECVFKWEQDRAKRKTMPIIGYVSYFELLNGFSKMKYMSTEDLYEHAKQYSETFKRDKGKWKDDPHSMSLKTVLKLNISKYGPLSVDMQHALTADQGIIKNFDPSTQTIDVSYPDNQLNGSDDEAPKSEITLDDLKALYEANFPILGAKTNNNAKRIIEKEEVYNYDKIAAEIRQAVIDAEKQS